MKLNERLEKVASFIPKDASMIDVGCDHAYLPIYLIENKLVKNAVASDNKEGPLKQAKKNIANSKLTNKIKVQLAEGIQKLDSDIDTIVISGMGGLQMIGICKYVPDQMKQIKTIVLSPNNEVEKVRREFVKMGFIIEDEILVKDHGVIYPVIKFKRGKKRYSKEEYLLGPILINKKEALFYEWNKEENNKKEKLLKILPKQYWKRKFEVKLELKIRRKYLI